MKTSNSMREKATKFCQKNKILVTIVVSAALSVFFILVLTSFGLPLYHVFFQFIIAGLWALLAPLLPQIKNKKSSGEMNPQNSKFNNNTTSKLIGKSTAALLVVGLFTSSMVILTAHAAALGRHEKATSAKREQENSFNVEESVEDTPEIATTTTAAYVFTVEDWKKDPFFLGLNKYCGRNVPDYEMEEEIRDLVYNILTNIEPIFYTKKDLVGSESDYEPYIRKANIAYRKYLKIIEKSGKFSHRQKELFYLEDELENRKYADEFLQLSANEKIIGDTYDRIADYHKDSNIAKAYTYYQEAFKYQSKAIITCASEFDVSDRTVLEQMIALATIAQRIVNDADHLSEFTTTNREDVMASTVAQGIRKSILRIIEENKAGIRAELNEILKDPERGDQEVDKILKILKIN